MRRGFKIAGKVLAAVVLTLVFLPVLLVLLFQVPAVQQFAVRQATALASRKLGTTVSIDRVDIGLFHRVSLEGLYVEDYQRDTLLYAGRLDARVRSLGLLGGGLVFERATLSGGCFCLRETPGGELNIKQLVDRLIPPDKPEGKGKFLLVIEDLQTEDFDFCMERIEARNPSYGVDFSRMRVADIRAELQDFTLDGPVIHTTIRHLAARERSGFLLDDFACRLYVSNGCIGMEELRIRTARSDVRMPLLTLVGLDWSRYKYFVEEVDIDARVERTLLSSDDMAYFASAMKEWHLTLEDLDLEMQGTVADFSASIGKLRIGEATRLRAQLAARGLPDVRRARFDLKLHELQSAARDVRRIASSVAGVRLAPKAVSMLENAGAIAVSGRFRGGLADFSLDAVLETSIGSSDCRLEVASLPDGCRGVRGGVVVTELQAGRLLKNAQLGKVSCDVRIDGEIGDRHADAQVAGRIGRLDFKGYTYDSLSLNGRFADREFNGIIRSRDPNLKFDFAGAIDLNGEVPRYDFALDLQEANLAATGINPRDSVALLSARLDAHAAGRSLDDLNGAIVVREARYRYNDREVTADSLCVRGRNDASDKFIELRSDFVDAVYEGKSSYREVFAYLKQRVRDYLPMFDGGTGWQGRADDTLSLADGYSQLTVHVRRINPLVNAIASGLQIADGSQLQLRLNPATDRLSLRINSDYVERNRMLLTRLDVALRNDGDSLVLAASTEDCYLGMLRMNRIGMKGGAKDNLLQLETDFADTTAQTSGRIGFRTEFVRGKGAEQRIDVKLTPSHLTRGDKTWNLYTDGIAIDTARIRIDRFRVVNRGQELLLDGVASRRAEDSLQLSLRNFDLAPFSHFTSSMGYSIDGRTNGSATVRSVLRDAEMRADIVVDSIRINEHDLPDLWLRSRWDFVRSRAGVIVQRREGLDTLIRGFYSPAQKRYYARATLPGANLSLLDPLLEGVIGSTQGSADVELTLQGTGRQATLGGRIDVSDFATKVDFTQVTYSMPRAVLTVENNRLTARGVPVYDLERNRGDFSIDLDLNHLSNIAYTVGVQPRGMMVLNTTQRDNDLFYGRVFASGSATIAGSKGGVKMNIVAATDDDSEFFMPLSGKSNVKQADFVTFVTREQADTTDYLLRKKLLFQSRNRSKKEAAGSSMDITMALDVKDNTAFQLVIDPTVGDILKGRGNGMLNLHINPGANVFEMYGDYTLTEGSYLLVIQNLINKKFIIEGGSMLQWTGEPVDARLDINAVYKLKTSLQPLIGGMSSSSGTQSGARSIDRPVPVDCNIHIGGRLSAPQLSFSVDVPVTDVETQAAVASALSTSDAQAQQFISLVALGTFSPESFTAGGTNVGASTGLATGLEMLTNQLSNWVSTDAYRINLNYRSGSEVTSDEVDFGFSTNLINNRLLVEVEGNYMIDSKQVLDNNVSNFMGEAHVTWLIDKAGNLRLNVFTQTIDRFDENQGLQETGLGISYKEDFNNFKDLKQRIRNRFVNEKRRERRRLRREERNRRAAEDHLSPEELPSPGERRPVDADAEREGD